MKIAIVGTGISGLMAARILHREHDITVFEADGRIGGHANTVAVTVDGVDHAVDTGFIVYNEPNYPGFNGLLRELGVATQPTKMSFGVSDAASGVEYRASNLNSIFAQRRNALKPAFLRMLTDIVRFNRAARALVERDRDPASRHRGPDESLGDFVARGHYSEAFVSQFLVPFGAALWSAEPATFTDFPALTYARFMYNHGLLNLAGRPQWRTVVGGSRSYVDALIAGFRDRIRVQAPVHKIVRRAAADGRTQIEILTESGPELFDRVVLATHSDQALRLLGEPTAAEQSVLGAIRYQPNTTTLHTDRRVLPANHRAWASWNYAIDAQAQRSTVTYWMNNLQSIESSRPLLVTLNRHDDIDERLILAEFEYSHPVFDAGAIAAQRRRAEIQGHRGVYFAGAYWGYGFHEDGVQSALDVVAAIGRDQ